MCFVFEAYDSLSYSYTTPFGSTDITGFARAKRSVDVFFAVDITGVINVGAVIFGSAFFRLNAGPSPPVWAPEDNSLAVCSQPVGESLVLDLGVGSVTLVIF